jgi:hypothetical protein
MPTRPSRTSGKPAPGGNHGLLASATWPQLPITPRREDIFRCLGYPRQATPPAHMVRAIEEIVAAVLPQVRPRGTYSLYTLTAQTAHSLTIGGAVLKGNIGEFLHGADRIAVFLVTVGSEITRLSEARCRAGDAFAGWALDAVGSWAAEAAADALMANLNPHLRADEGLTLRYSPGYCGMDLAEQRKLFRLAQAESIGISLLPSLLMEPLKSISGIVGLGPRSAVGVTLSPCDRCPLVGCHMRR